MVIRPHKVLCEDMGRTEGTRPQSGLERLYLHFYPGTHSIRGRSIPLKGKRRNCDSIFWLKEG
jgi:hypothetical protein